MDPSSVDTNNVFDQVLLEVGDSGKFQKRFNILFNFFYVLLSTMASFNIIIAVATPEHWCHIPGRENSNYSVAEWKKIHIPRNSISDEFKRCKMFNNTAESFNLTQGCSSGWDYDDTYYGRTIASAENWVCSDELRLTNFLVFIKIGEIIGTCIFAQIGDIFGRRPVYYLSTLVLLIGRLGLIFASGNYYLIVILSIIGNLSALSMFQTPLVISMEISNVEDRTFISLLQCIAWTLGLCTVPLIFWLVHTWVPFILMTTLPLVIFLFLDRFMIESPMWLANKGKMHRCLDELQKISKVNKTQISDKMLMQLNSECVASEEKNYGALSLFGSWKLARRTVLVIIGWVTVMIIYFVLYLNVSNLKGNPFLNYFWQGLAELPGYAVGTYLSDKIGRKSSRITAFSGLAIFSSLLAYFLTLPSQTFMIAFCGMAMKLFASMGFYVINLHTLEIYPTCLRQNGSSVGYLVASIFGLFAPYIIYIGTSVNASFPYIFSLALAVIGGVCGIFLPETLHQKLPETIREAEHFGADQKVLSFRCSKRSAHEIVKSNDENLRL